MERLKNYREDASMSESLQMFEKGYMFIVDKVVKKFPIVTITTFYTTALINIYLIQI
jgi:hypothetical protein